MNFQGKTLQPFELNILLRHFETFSFHHDYSIIHEGQIPQAVIILLRGRMDLMIKKKFVGSISPGRLLGVQQVLHGSPLTYNCLIRAGSDCLFIQKSELLSIHAAHPSDLKRLILIPQASQLPSAI